MVNNTKGYIEKSKKKKRLNNKNAINLSKSAILSLFSTKSLTKINTNKKK